MSAHAPLDSAPKTGVPARLWELAAVFLRLGSTAFGGPAAHIGIMHDEVVRRRRWMEDQEFLDLLGATNLIPGPNSTELAIHLGLARAGWPGLIVAGVSFILPAMTIVLLLSRAYVTYGSLPQTGWILYGIQPVVIAIIVHALWRLGRSAIHGWLTALVAVGVLAGYFAGMNEIALLLAGGLLAMLARNARRLRPAHLGLAFLPAAGAGVAQALASFSLSTLFFTFLKIGAVLYGSGYVLLAFLRADFIVRLGWLTDRQLIDAVSIGQVTPGPVFTTATFIGYLLGGLPGGLLATLGIFLPSFFFVAISQPLIPRLRQSSWMSGLLDGVSAASLGLMGAVTWQLGRTAVRDPLSAGVALVSAVILLRGRVNSTWLILAGALLGVLRFFLST
jgi:chromate transporter